MDEFKKDIKAEQEAKHVRDINLLNMIESRIMEIVQIEDECKKKLPKLFSQRLPRFMRRRAACHDIKRMPRKLRPHIDSNLKPRKSLLKYRQKKRFRKHKRILKRHARHKYRDLDKCLMHKWFAKRFKMSSQGPLNHVPLYNSTKNQRNLYRQTRFGCAFISMAHLAAIQLTFVPDLTVGTLRCQLMQLNQLAFEISGFTFNARALGNTNYEILIHLYEPIENASVERDYICSVMAHLNNIGSVECPEKTKQQRDTSRPPAQLTLWVPREKVKDVTNHLMIIAEQLNENKFVLKKISPSEETRVRLVGPDAWTQAVRVSEHLSDDSDTVKIDATKTNPVKPSKASQTDMKVGEDCDPLRPIHTNAQDDASQRLGSANDYKGSSFGLTIGRYVEEKFVDFIYYNTEPRVVDLIFKTKKGRHLWYQLVKNKAHLVGGYRDLDRLLPAQKYKLIPDHIVSRADANAMQV